MARPRVLLIVDHRNLIYRATNVHGSLFSGRTFTGGVFGFLSLMLRAVRDTEATHVVVATDTRPYLRSALFPAYKGDRDKRKESRDLEDMLKKAAQSAALIEQLLHVLDIPLWSCRGLEYDDLCAWAVRRYAARFDSIVAVTNDSDLYQLFDVPQFAVYKGAGKGGLYTRQSFVREYGELTSDQWVLFLSMTGTHNAVPGIHGIGPARARKVLSDAKALRAMLTGEHARMIIRNRALIELPYADMPAQLPFKTKRHEISVPDFVRWCARYEIQATAVIADAVHELKRASEDG